MNSPHTIGERVTAYRHVLEFGPNSVKVALELSRAMLERQSSLENPDWNTHRTVVALLHCAELAAERIETVLDRATGWSEIPD